ncbi:SMI1/KNR4 family protein [Noviherbaspirillum sp. Root189]|uniref:SMI1/KNR4 family protein n=1 Tax=Noviherbaspirillum sp. Root189 TaxID=1736487 RepID=UPI00070E3395|nr:SMI1/KNR4 family protein [Noviherbaspirillum sp. Root189]KRB79905.1 cell wall assembly protein [Noviherbaspirillum sp. Root189]
MPFDLNERYVAEAEAKLGAVLPASYRSAMMVANGGEIAVGAEDWFLYPILDQSDKRRIARTCNDIVAETKTQAEQANFPSHAVALGNNGAGDQLLFLRAGDAFEPSVYVWSHETGELTRVVVDFGRLERL